MLIPSQGYLAGLAGKKVYAHQMPVSDYAKSGLPEASWLEEEFARAIRERRFALILDSNTAFLRSYPRGEILERHYEPAGPVFADDAVFRPISGAPIRPGLFWRPRADADTGGSSEP